jgi:hypothetical protein
MMPRPVFGLIAGVLAGIAAVPIYRQADALGARGAGRKGTATGATDVRSYRQPALRDELYKRHQRYLGERSRHHRVLLDEIIAAYLRTEPEECLALLREWNLAYLVSQERLESLLLDDSGDLGRALQLASSMSGKRGDALIRTAFRKKIASDPNQAFELLGSLPKYLVEELSSELARKWGARDGPKAAEAFLKCSTVSSWRTQFSDALRGWAGRDPEAAFQFLQQSPLLAPPLNRGELLQSLALAYPSEAAKILKAEGPLAGTRLSGLLQVDPQEALKLASGTPGSYGRNWQLQNIAGHIVDKDPGLALRTALEMPKSERSLFLIREAARKLGGTASQDSFALAEQQSDSYHREAAIAGVTEGLYRSRNVGGLAEVVQQGISSNNPEWLESAGSLILNGPPKYMSFLEYSTRLDQQQEGGNIIISGAGSQMPKTPDWKTLDPEMTAALIQYAEKNWPAEKADALKKKFQRD